MLRHSYSILIYILCLLSCINAKKHAGTSSPTKKETTFKSPLKKDTNASFYVPDFNPDNAYAYIEKQVSFGPRVPNISEHTACAKWLIDTLNQMADTVFVQRIKLKAYDNKILNCQNIIASFNPHKKKRILLCAHWDTRHIADQDVQKRNKPIDGANDGASGVGVLLEIAHLLSLHKIDIGVDIILFDAEDYGQPSQSAYPPMENSYCLGSQYWSKHPHIKSYTAQYGILLDMVGAKGSTFTKEGISMQYAPDIVNKVWETAQELSYDWCFVQDKSSPLIDDHLYINKIARIPTIDIIHRTKNTWSGFGSYWHTHYDNTDIIDKHVLKAVGQTVLETIYKDNYLWTKHY